MTRNSWLYRWMRRPVAVISWAAALLLAGAWAATQAPVEWVPTVHLPGVNIAASWGDAAPRSVERYVTAPIERAVQRVPGTVNVRSLSETGQSSVTVDVAEEVDLGRYVLELNEQLRILADALPDGVRPRLTKRVPREFQNETGFLTLQLIGPLSLDALRKVADEEVAPKLRSVRGVAEVEVSGGTRREVLVSLEPDRLAMFGLSPDDVRSRLLDLFTASSYGSLRGGGEALPLLSRPESRLEAIRAAVVRPADSLGQLVRLRDVASIDVGPEPVRSISRIDGQPVVTLAVERTRGSHMLRAAEEVEERLREIQRDLPEGVRLLVAADQTEEVRGELRDLAWRGGVGLLLVIVALLFMLRSTRAAAVVLFGVAVSMGAAFLLLVPLEMTLNKITIAGLVLLFGLIVDNAVVVVEQLMMQRERRARQIAAGGEAAVESAVESVRAVWLPLVGGTLSTVVVMLPLVYLSKDLRVLFLPFGILVSLTMATSLAGAGLVVPVLGRFLPAPEPVRRVRWFRAATAAPYRWIARFPRSTLLLLVAILGVPIWLLPTSLPEVDDPERLPERRLASLYNATIGASAVDDVRKVVDPAVGGIMRKFTREVRFGARWSYSPPPTVRTWLRFPPGNPIERADSLIGIFERAALTSEAVERTIVRVDDRSANLEVIFPRDALRTAEPFVVRENLIRRAVGLAGIDVGVSGLTQDGNYYSSTGMSSSGMTVTAYGPSYDELERLSDAFAERLKSRSRRVVDVTSNSSRYGREGTRDVLQIGWSADARAASGATTKRVADTFRPVFTPQMRLFDVDLDEEGQLPLRMEVRGADALDVARVMDRPLNVGDSLSVRLAGLASYAVRTIPAAIERENQQYKRYIQVDYRGPWQMGNELIQKEVESTALPAGYRLDTGYNWFFTQEVKKAFGWVLLATLLLVYLATAAVFESWRLPFVVLLSLPTAAIGVAAGFLITEADFAEGAFIGVVLLVGIAVNDSILLADRFRQLRQARPWGGADRLIRLAVRERLRPMWTTTLTTAASLLPLLLFPDGDEFWVGLAVTVIGGLVASTLLAPVATVAMLSLRRRTDSSIVPVPLTTPD